MIETLAGSILSEIDKKFNSNDLDHFNHDGIIPEDFRHIWNDIQDDQIRRLGPDRSLNEEPDEVNPGDPFSPGSGPIINGGIDALALYKSARYLDLRPFPGYWGIFYLEPALRYLVALMSHYNPRHTFNIENARRILWAHEFFHFRIDMSLANYETFSHRPLYTPYTRAYSRGPSQTAEEALANRAMYQFVSRSTPSLKSMVEDLCDCQPNEYARFRENQFNLKRRLASQILISACYPHLSSSQPNFEAFASGLALVGTPLNNRWQCPEYVISGKKVDSLFRPLQTGSLPPVNTIVDHINVQKVLKKKSEYRNKWNKQKSKIIKDPYMPGLGFKPWSQDLYSVKIDQNWRAHLQCMDKSIGAWETKEIGSHKQLGHG